MSVCLAEIETQGEVLVNSCSLVYDGEGVKVLHLDLKTKYAEVEGYSGSPGIILGVTSRSTNKGEERGLTEVIFPRYDGYNAVAADCMRYTCFVALMKSGFGMIETVNFDKNG